MRILWVVLLIYALGFVFFFPKALTNFDEVSYVRQAAAFAQGSATVDTVDPFTGSHQKVHPSDYPPGTSALMTPLVWLAGWRGAFAVGLLALVACVLFTARWIAESGGSPLYALMILAYPPTLVMARTGMSDLPSACLVAAGLWLFWPGKSSTPWRRLLAGFLAGASLCLREPNLLLFAFFFAGALLRRERHSLALISGGIVGLVCRFVSSAMVYDDPLFVKQHVYRFTGHYTPENLTLYLTALLVLLPGGLIWAMLYRGRRCPELILTTLSFLFLFVLYDYNASPSSGLRQWVLAPRFFIPLLPILAFAAALTVPHYWTRFLGSRRLREQPTWQALGRVAMAISLVAICAEGLAANWADAIWGNRHEHIVRALYSHTDASHPVLADLPATVKFLNELHGQRIEADLLTMSETDIQRLMDRYGTVDVVFFDRNDSDYWLQKARHNRTLLEALARRYHAKLSLEQRFAGLGILQVWRIGGAS